MHIGRRVETYQNQWEGMVHGKCKIQNKRIICIDTNTVVFEWARGGDWILVSKCDSRCWDDARDLIVLTLYPDF